MSTNETAIADIQRVAATTEHGTVSRSKYRDEGKFSTFEIDNMFGSFTEFKRQAGLMLTREQAKLTNQVAKHVSTDDIRKLNIDRADYGERYLKPSGKRFQTIMVCTDVHDIEVDAFWRRVFIDSVRRVQPDVVCIGGDLFDLPEFGKYNIDPREWDVVGRIKFVHSFIGEIREAAPDAQIDLIEGNHEFRLLRHMAEATPALKAILSDLHGFTVGKLLGLDDFEVRYIARGDLGAWNKGDIKKELGRNYEVYHDTLLVDHFPDGVRRGLSGFNGHHHKFEAVSFYSHLRGPQMWMQLGCGHRRSASYCEGERWNMGFAISHIDTQEKRVAMNYIPVSDFAEVGGKFYFRKIVNDSYKDDLIGAKGGGSTFRSRPDNLRSTDTFEALLGLCAGRIKGLAPGGLQNLFVDDVPIEDGSGNRTLSDFNAIIFNGDPAILQPITLQLGGSAGANSINLAVNNANTGATSTAGPPGDWRFGSVTQANVDYIDLRFIVNALYRQDKKGIYDTTASIEVQLQPSGSSTWYNPLIGVAAPAYNSNGISLSGKSGVTAYIQRDMYDPINTSQWNETAPGYIQITGKTTQAYVKELRIAVPNTGNYVNRTWQVRVRLMERDTYTQDTDEERRSIVWESVAGVSMAPIGNKESWRGLAYMQINGKASDQLTGIPEITGIYDLSMVRVPPSSVWNADTRVYTGSTWDGATEEIQWTKCPAFQIKDLIEDGISGISALVPGSTMNKWDTLEASKWFAQQVPNGQGGTHCRYSMNYLLDSSMAVSDLMQYSAGAVGAYAWDEGDGHWRMIVEKPENPTALFTKENIVGEFQYSHTDVDTRYNDIVGVFRNEDRRFQEDRVRVFDQSHIDDFGRRATSLALVGCTNRQEALRRVKLRQLTSLNETRQVNFVTNRQGLMIGPLSIIMIADADLGNQDKKTTGRLTNISGTTLQLRDYLRLELGVAYTLRLTVPNPDYNPDATSQPSSVDWRKPTITITRTITNDSTQRGDVKTLYIDSALPANTPPNAPVAFEAVGLPTLPKQYRVLDVEPQDNELVTISAIEIYTSKWVESDAVNESDILAQVPHKTVPTPTNLQFAVKSFVSEFQTKRVLSVSWDRPVTKWFDGFKVDYKFNGGQATNLNPKTQDSFAELQEPQDGLYEFNIYTLDKRSGTSLPLVGTYQLGEAPPPGSENISVSTNTVSIISDYTGTVIDGQLPYYGWARYAIAQTDVSAATTWTINAVGCTAYINADGSWNITAVSTNGYIDITGTYNGKTLTAPRVTVIKNQQGSPPSNSGTGGSFTAVSATTYPSGPMAVTTVSSGANGSIKFSGSVSYNANGTGNSRSFTLAGKLAYRVAGSGSGWTDVAAETVGSEATFIRDTSDYGGSGGHTGVSDTTQVETGYLQFPSTTKTGLTANTSYEFGAFFRKYSGVSNATLPYGSITGEQA